MFGRRLLIIVLLVETGLQSSGCIPFGDGGVEAEGLVQDLAGKPVAGALIFFSMDTGRELFVRRTGAAGDFHISRTVAPGRYKILLVIQAAGFKPIDLAVPTLRRNRVLVRLATTESQEASQVSLSRVKE